MNASPDSFERELAPRAPRPFDRSLFVYARAMGVLGALVGCIALGVRALDGRRMSTALMSIFAGMALVLLGRAHPSRAARAAANLLSTLVCLAAVLALAQSAMGNGPPYSAAGFMAIGAGLLLLDVRTSRGPQLAECLALVAGGLAVI